MLITWRVNFGKGFMQSFSYVSVHCRWKKDKSCLPNSFYSSQVAQHHFRTKLRGFDVKNISCKKIKICPVSIAQCWLTSSVHMTLDLFDWTQWPPCFMFEGNTKTLVHILERTFISIMVSTWKKKRFHYTKFNQIVNSSMINDKDNKRTTKSSFLTKYWF